MTTFDTLKSSARAGFRSALPTAWWMLKITIVVSFAVMLLQYCGVIGIAAAWLEPLFGWLGLRGEAALVFLSGALVNHYAAIAIIETIGFDARSITILALMLLCAHNLIVETTIQKKTGSSPTLMVLLRLTLALLSAIILNFVLPEPSEVVVPPTNSAILTIKSDFMPTFLHWAASTAKLALLMFFIIVGLTILQRILADTGAIRTLSKRLRPLMRLLGLPPKTSFLWIVAQTLGLAYGAAVMLEEKERGKVSRRELDLLNHHIAASHSNIEDVMLYFALGASLLWMYVLRLALAVATVWLRRGILKLFYQK